MTASATNPEGLPQRCSICGQDVRAWPSAPLDDAPCPRCGSLLIWFRDALSQRLAEGLGVSPDGDYESSLAELRIDSLDIVELVMEIEEEFGIHIPDADYEGMRTIGDLIRCLRRRQLWPPQV